MQPERQSGDEPHGILQRAAAAGLALPPERAALVAQVVDQIDAATARLAELDLNDASPAASFDPRRG